MLAWHESDQLRPDWGGRRQGQKLLLSSRLLLGLDLGDKRLKVAFCALVILKGANGQFLVDLPTRTDFAKLHLAGLKPVNTFLKVGNLPLPPLNQVVLPTHIFDLQWLIGTGYRLEQAHIKGTANCVRIATIGLPEGEGELWILAF